MTRTWRATEEVPPDAYDHVFEPFRDSRLKMLHYGPGETVAGLGGKQVGSGGFIAPMNTNNCPLDV